MHRKRSLLPGKMPALWTELTAATALLLLLAQTSTVFADTCTFDDGLCGWKTGDCKARACFKISKVAESPHGPSYDHSNKTDRGFCAYSTLSTSLLAIRSAEISRSVKGPFCFTAWYHQSGPQHEKATFSVEWKNYLRTQFYSTQRDMDGRWQRVRYSERRPIEGKVLILHYPADPFTKGVFAVDDLTLDPGECPADPQDGSCDFDFNNTCGYDVGEETGGWQLETSKRTQFYWTDFSTDTRQGGLMFLQTGKKNFTRASFVSPKLPARAKVQCLRFYYYLERTFGTTQRGYVLKVTLTGDSGRVKTLWYRLSEFLVRGTWSAGDAAFKAQEGFRLKFEVATLQGSTDRPFCAIDAIEIRDCSGKREPQDRLCDFEDGWCSWRNIDNWPYSLAWMMGGGSIKTTVTRPQQDHTHGGNSTGSYVFVSSFERRKGERAELVSEIFPFHSKITQCVEFWYVINGGKDTSLKARALKTTPDPASRKPLPLWTQEGDRSIAWKMGRFAAPHYSRVVFTATVGTGAPPEYVALDDIAVISVDLCQTTPNNSEALEAEDLLSCPFDRTDYCHWTADAVTQRPWMYGPPLNTNLGPRGAPQGVKGGMMFVTGRVLTLNDGAVILNSPTVGSQPEAVCVSVWYHMFGGRGTRMRMWSLQSDISAGAMWKKRLIFRQDGRTTSDRWYNVRRTVMLDGPHNKLALEAANGMQRSKRNESVLALGPLEVTPGACDVLTDGRGYCDFEFDECGWTAANGWERKVTRPLQLPDMGPRSGPVNSAYFLQATTISSGPNGATLTSPEWTGMSEPQCLEFWYQSVPAKVVKPQLQVEVFVKGKKKLVWRQSLHPFSDWMLGRVQIVEENKFKVVFRANFSGVTSAVLNLDSVVLRQEPCDHPASCNFVNGLCGYVNQYAGPLRWLVGNGRLESRRLQPGFPLNQGFPPTFAYLDLTTGKGENDLPPPSDHQKTVGLASPLFDVTDDNTTLALYYFRNGPDIKTARLVASCYGDSDSSSGKGPQGVDLVPVLVRSLVSLALPQGTNCQVTVVVTRGDGTNGSMAIGPIKVTPSQPAEEPEPANDSATSCTFEDGTMCGWSSGGKSLKWVLNDPSKKIPDYPRSDHTLQAYRGRFVFVTSSKEKGLQVADFNSPELDLNGTKTACISYWRFGIHDNYIKTGVLLGNRQFYTPSSRSSHRWNHVLVTLSPVDAKIKLTIRVFMGRGLVALDDIRVTAGSCPERDLCTWEPGSLCSIQNGPGSFRPWIPRRAVTVGIPDHTLQSLNGSYLYLNTTAVDSHHPASRVFFSPRPPTEGTCVTFWWRGRGARSQINVYRFTAETMLKDALVSVVSYKNGDWWNARTITITSRNNWRLVFEVVAAANAKEDSAVLLDDIQYTNGKCPPYEYCTFEDECLPWQVLTDGSQEVFDVERAGSFKKLPRDHTTGTEDGYYLLFKNTGTKDNVSALALREPLRYNCASLWYYLPKLTGGVQLVIQSENITASLGTWKRYQMRYPALGRSPIAAISGSNPDGFVAIDDLLISENSCDDSIRPSLMFNCGADKQAVSVERVCDFVPDCKNGADERNCGQCDFSQGTCGWNLGHRLNLGNGAWRRTKIGSNPNAPQIGADRKRDGYYLLLSANITNLRQGVSAVVQSPTIRNTNKLCSLSFWYNYNQTGKLIDVTLDMKVGGYIMAVWTLRAHSRKPPEGVWNEAVVDIGRYRTDVTFYFRSNHLFLGQATFAVDHIDYYGCALPAKTRNCSSDLEFQCANGACSPRYARCNYVDDCGDNSDEENCEDHRVGCNFDTSFCEWVPQAPPTREASRWIRRGASAFLQFSPSRDHTTGTPAGKFIVFQANNRKGNATIIGPKFNNLTVCAISFFHTVHGLSNPQLTLNVRSTRNGPWKTVWKQSRPTQFWHFEAAFVQFRENAPFQVAFIGEHRVSGVPGYIAIDDITFFETCEVYYGALPDAPATPKPPPSICDDQEFQCGSSTQCIPQAQVCDFRSDCSNGADEARCGACDFSDDLCGLTNLEPDARFGWNFTRARDVKRNNNFPDSDSQQNENGAYAAYSLLNPGVPLTRFKSMVTPPLGPIAHSCIVSFYGYIPNIAIGSLTFGVLPPSKNGTPYTNGVPLAALTGSALKGRWRKISVAMGNWDAGARFFYRSDTVGTSVDLIDYSNCHPDTQAEGSEASRKVSCDFSNPYICGWFPERQASYTNWILFSGAAERLRMRWQPTDSVSHNGAYMYAVNLFAIKKTAHLVSIKMGPTPEGGRCFTFWYNMWHPNSGFLNVLKRVSNVSTSLLWTRSGSQGKAWQQGQIQVHSDDPHQLVFEAVMGPLSAAVIAIDHFILKDGRCNTGKGCTFEFGSCGWQLHNWELRQGSSVTLPPVDHSTQAPAGTFALVKAPGGRMVSAPGWYDASKHKCLRFWYFITGAATEALNITLEAKQGQQSSIWMGTKADAPTARWYSAAAVAAGSPGSTTMVFEGATSGNPQAAVAVDDITLSEVACPNPGSCSFEEDMCNWFNNRGPGYGQWFRNRGATASAFGHLITDHTLNTTSGYYLLLDSEDLSATNGGSLQSQRLNLGPAVCFKLYYYRRKEASVSLNVTFVDSLGKPVGKAASMDNNAPSEWTLLSVEQSDLPDQFSIVITAKTSFFGGNVAIDDIDVGPGKCNAAPDVPTTAAVPETTVTTSLSTSVGTDEPSPEETTAAPRTEQPSTAAAKTEVTAERTTVTPRPPPPPPKPPMKCSRGSFNCRDGVTCIPLILVCDGIRDCPNGLDEKCGSTNVCKEDEFFCSSRSPSACLPRSVLCDGKEDCAGGSDESLCRACPHNLCLNEGLCTWTPREPSPICECSGDYEGRRCQFPVASSAQQQKQELKDVGVVGPVVTGVLVTLALIIIGAAVTVVVLRRRRLAAWNSPFYLNNPTYDAASQETRLS